MINKESDKFFEIIKMLVEILKCQKLTDKE